jgi:GTP-binding protein EngB required for normal cell division
MVKNVIIIGQSGAGKSSLINMLCPHAEACVGNDAIGCTSKEQVYQCDLGTGPGQVALRCMVHDTIGLEEGRWGFLPAPKANKRLKAYLKGYMQKKELDLVVYCMSGQRVCKKKSQGQNYKSFKSVVGKVPMVLVVTKLGSGGSQNWWSKNSTEFEKLGMGSEGYACVTDDSNRQPYDKSYQAVATLISSKIF